MAALAADASLTTPATATAGLEGGAAGDGGEPGDGGGGNSPAGGEVVVGGGSGSWERACGLLRAATEVLASAERGAGGGGAPAEDVPFEAAVMDAAVEGIRHEEVRVRQAAGDALGALAGHRGAQVWAAAAPVVLANVEQNAALDESQRAREASRLAQQTLAGAAAAVPPTGGGAPPPPGRGDQGATADVPTDVPTDVGGAATATGSPTSGGGGAASAVAASPSPPSGGDVLAMARDRGRRMVHETEGWRGLETSLSALAKLLSGAGAPVLAAAAAAGGGPTADPHVAAALAFTVAGHTHANRFVRETCLGVLTALLSAAATADGTAPAVASTAAPGAGPGTPADAPASAPLVDALVPTVAPVVAAGLADNWSQVRYAASVCVRVLLASGSSAAVEPYVSDLLLPRLLLNRHYVADGVRVYSLGTYATSPVTASGRGRATLIAHLPAAVSYCVSQAGADNHAVREAACRSLAEVAAALPADAVTPLLGLMIPALVTATDDGSWPVRDVAMDAIASVAAAYPAAVAATGVLDGPDGVVAVWHAALQDVIPSVRTGAAACIARAAAAYGAVVADASAAGTPVPDAVAAVAALLTPQAVAAAITARLATPLDVDAATAPALSGGATADAERPSGAITGFGPVAKAARDNDAALHTGQTVYSCGSLAPKMPARRSTGAARPPVAGGCSGGGHGPPPPAAAWHAIDGGLRLWVAVLTAGPGPLRDAAVPLLAAVAAVARRAAGAPFAQAAPLLGCVWAAVVEGVPAIGGSGGGGEVVDPSAFADALAVSTACGQRGVEVAAKRAASELAAAVARR